MIKKIFHLLIVLFVGIMWSLSLGLFVWQILKIGFHIDVLSAKTYKGIVIFWNNGGVIKGKDLLIFLIMFLYFPICIYGWHKINNFKFLLLITTPLNWYLNRGIKNYHAPDVNIKNLKLEDKKTLEQYVNERLEIEKKKMKNISTVDLRKDIIKRIEEK